LWGQCKRSGRMVTVCHSSTLDSRLLDLNSTEQSENVYENKAPAPGNSSRNDRRAVREPPLRSFQNENGGVSSQVGEEGHLGVLGGGGGSERDFAEDL